MQLGPGSLRSTLSPISSCRVFVHSARLLSGWAVGKHPWAPAPKLVKPTHPTGLFLSHSQALGSLPLLHPPSPSSASVLCSQSPSSLPHLLDAPLPPAPQCTLHPTLSTHLHSLTPFVPMPRESHPLLPGPCAPLPRIWDPLHTWDRLHRWDPPSLSTWAACRQVPCQDAGPRSIQVVAPAPGAQPCQDSVHCLLSLGGCSASSAWQSGSTRACRPWPHGWGSSPPCDFQTSLCQNHSGKSSGSSSTSSWPWLLI